MNSREGRCNGLQHMVQPREARLPRDKNENEMLAAAGAAD
jgi:hypothetical protein